MRIIESDFKNHVKAFVQNKLANIFFLNHIAVVEMNEGVHFNSQNAEIIIDEINSYFGNSKPFGIVANRINSYSVDLVDAPLYRKKLKNLKAYGVVGYNQTARMCAKMESMFCLSDNVDHDSIYDAINQVYNTVKRSRFFSLG